MKKKVLALSLLFLSTTLVLLAQDPQLAPCSIFLKEGESVSARHFGQAECDGNDFYTGYIMLKGKYMGMITKLKDYKDIRKLELIGFDKAPEHSTENQKGKIVVHKKNGIIVTLEDAELTISCMGNDELYNEIKVQVINPLTEKISEKTIPVMDIKTVIFQ